MRRTSEAGQVSSGCSVCGRDLDGCGCPRCRRHDRRGCGECGTIRLLDDVENRDGYLYFAQLDEERGALSVYRRRLPDRHEGAGPDELLVETEIEPEYSRFVYLVNGDGDLAVRRRKGR